MTSIGAATAPAPYHDRAAWAQRIADTSNGKMTVEEVTAEFKGFDQRRLEHAQTIENVYAGRGTPVNGTTADQLAKGMAEARASRGERYKYVSGPVQIEAMNVNSAVKAQSALTGGDLKDLSLYADYLRDEVTSANKVRSDVTFTGTWGTDRVTNDVNEYISWLYQAAQGTSPSSD